MKPSSANPSASSGQISTTVKPYTADDIRRYGQRLFPADLVWQFFAPAEPTTAADVLLGLAQSTRRDRVKQTLREWRVGKDSILPLISSAARLRELMADSKTGRYAAGPIRLGPAVNLKTTPILDKQFVIDLDATDYTKVGVRAFCKCGDAKAKLCPICIKVIRTVARLAVDILEQVYLFKRVYCLFSGGRGIHIRVLDYQASCLTTEMRKVIADTIQNALTQPALANLCEPLRRLPAEIGMPQNTVIPPIIDYNVTIEMKKPTRGPFSVHQATGRFCIPIESPEAFVSVEAVSPTIHEVLAAVSAGRPHDERWTKAIVLLEKWTTI